MQALVCELCGSNDIVKQDGYYVCQHCGTKYTPEEARKMMVEGTVKIDNSAFVEKYLANARRAMQKEDWEEVEKYYNLVEQNDPSNIEAIFYSSYGKARLSMVENDIYKRQQICDVFCNSISVIDDNYDVSKSEENQKIIAQMSIDLFKMYGTSFVYTQTTQNGSVVSDNRNKTYFLFVKMAAAFVDSLRNIINIDDQLIYWKIVYLHEKYIVGNTGTTLDYRKEAREIALKIAQKIHEEDPSFEIEEIPEPVEKSGGCYVATAVYGSYDCPQVWTLRRFRDDTLAGTWYGRAFIHTYYAVSPTLVRWFGRAAWFRNLWKPALDRMVARLNREGVADTPYQDRDW